jgi:hypothetical protein
MMDPIQIDDTYSALLTTALEVAFDSLSTGDDRRGFVERALGRSHPAVTAIAPDQWAVASGTLASVVVGKVCLFRSEPAVGRRNAIAALNYQLWDASLHACISKPYRKLCGRYGCRAPLVEDIDDGFLNGPPDDERVGAIWEVADIIAQSLDPTDIRRVWSRCVRLSSQLPCDVPEGASASDACYHLFACLADVGVYAHNNRHPLYEVLDCALDRIHDPERRDRIRWLMREMEASFPQLETLGRPAKSSSSPTVIEVKLDPSRDAYLFEIRRDSELVDEGGEAHLDPGNEHRYPAVSELVTRLKAVKNTWDLGSEARLVFRVPWPLMSLPFERWNDDRSELDPIGITSPVMVALNLPRSLDHGWNDRRKLWDALDLAACFESSAGRCAVRFADEATGDDHKRERARLNQTLDRHPCLILAHTPNERCRSAVTSRGAPIALWPRHTEGEPDLDDVLLGLLGDAPIAEIPERVRDQRRRAQYEDAAPEERHPIWRHLTLYWDRPYQPGFFPGNN